MAGQREWFDAEEMNPKDWTTLPFRYLPRSTPWETEPLQLWWYGVLANGSSLSPGTYTMRYAQLRPFGNPTVAADWDVVPAPRITVTSKWVTEKEQSQT